MIKRIITKAVLICSVAITGLTSCAPEPTVYESMPPVADWEKAYLVLMEKAKINDTIVPEFFGLSFVFSQSESPEPKNNDALLIASMVDPENKDNIYKYTYSLRDKKMHPREKVSLITATGKNTQTETSDKDAEKITKYEDFAGALFTRDAFPTLAQMDEILRIALEKSGIEKTSIRGFEFETNFTPHGRIIVEIAQGTELTAKKQVYFSCDGKFTDTN